MNTPHTHTHTYVPAGTHAHTRTVWGGKETRINFLLLLWSYRVFLPSRFPSFCIQANLERLMHIRQQTRNHVWCLRSAFATQTIYIIYSLPSWVSIFGVNLNGPWCSKPVVGLISLSFSYRFTAPTSTERNGKSIRKLMLTYVYNLWLMFLPPYRFTVSGPHPARTGTDTPNP